MLLFALACSAPAYYEPEDGGATEVDAGGPQCVLPPWPGDIEIARRQDSPGPYPPCPEGLPQGRMRIEAVRYSGVESKYFTYLDVTSLDFDQPCGAGLIVILRQEIVQLAPGTVIRVDARITVRDFEEDVNEDWVIRDDEGTLLLALARGTRPKIFASKLYALTLSTDSPPICRYNSKYSRLRVHLVADGNDCMVEGQSQRCCPLWGGAPYEVRMDSADEVLGEKQSPSITFLIRQKGLVRSMGVEPAPPPICP